MLLYDLRIQAHIFVAFLAYCLHVTLGHRLKHLAPGLTTRQVLEKFCAVQMIDVRIPTTDGRELTLTRYTQPEPELKLLLEKLKLTLKGGVFDLGDDWQSPHREHRRGRDVDINTAGVPCLEHLALRQAVDKFLVPLQDADRPLKSALSCEENGFKHLDVTTFVPLP